MVLLVKASGEAVVLTADLPGAHRARLCDRPDTYWVAKKRPPYPRRVRDEYLKVEIERVHADNLGGASPT